MGLLDFSSKLVGGAQADTLDDQIKRDAFSQSMLQLAAGINPYGGNVLGDVARGLAGGRQVFGEAANRQATQGMSYEELAQYWADKDKAKSDQYLALADRQAKQRSDSESKQRLQSVLSGVQGGLGGAQAIQAMTGNDGYSQQAEQLARAGIQAMQQGDFALGQKLLAQAKGLNELRTQGRETRLGDSVVNTDPYAIGQSMTVGESPDSKLSANTARRAQNITIRGQDMAQQRFDQEQAQKNKASSGGNLSSSAGEIAGSLGRVSRLLGETGTTGLSGRLVGATGLPTDRKALESELESLQSQLAFAEIARLKGEGVTFGALSDPERVAIGRSVANLDPNQPEDALRAQLQRVYDKFKQYQPDSYASMGGFMKQKSNKTRGQGGGFKVIGRE